MVSTFKCGEIRREGEEACNDQFMKMNALLDKDINADIGSEYGKLMNSSLSLYRTTCANYDPLIVNRESSILQNNIA